jgi:hypothetical protein
MPPAFLMEGLKEANEKIVFGTLEGPNFTEYKLGNECDDSTDPHIMLKILRTILPSKIDKITHV